MPNRARNIAVAFVHVFSVDGDGAAIQGVTRPRTDRLINTDLPVPDANHDHARLAYIKVDTAQNGIIVKGLNILSLIMQRRMPPSARSCGKDRSAAATTLDLYPRPWRREFMP
jgi:hypothetical protein